MSNNIKITMRQNSGTQFEVEVDAKGTVFNLKEACASKAEIPAEEQRLIFKGKLIIIPTDMVLMICLGKILKDENTLEEYKIEDGVTVHLVKGKSAAASGSTSSASTS